MAFLPQDQQNQNAPQGQTTNAPPQGTGGSVGAGTGGPKAGAAPNSGTPTQFGSSASKLGDYLSANAPQITNQANQIAGTLGNQYNQVNQDITNTGNQFNQAVQGGYTAGNSSLVDQATKNASQFVQDPNNVKAFQAQYNDQYTGPQNFEGSDQYGNIQNEVNNAVQNSQLLKTAPGLQSYFATQQQNPTQASTSLDQLLVQGNPNAKATVENAANQFNTLTGTLGNTTTAADQNIQAAQDAANAARTYAQTQLGNTTNQFNQNVNQQTTAAQQQAADQIAQLNADITNQSGPYGIVNALDKLGYTRDQYNALMDQLNQATNKQYLTAHNAGADTATTNVNLADYLHSIDPNTAINSANTASADQYVLANALQQLYGTNPAPQLALDPTQSALAGTAPKNLSQFNYDQLLQSLTNFNQQAQAQAQAQANAQAAAQDAAHAASKQHGFGGFINRAIAPVTQYAVNPLLTVPKQISTAKGSI